MTEWPLSPHISLTPHTPLLQCRMHDGIGILCIPASWGALSGAELIAAGARAMGTTSFGSFGDSRCSQSSPSLGRVILKRLKSPERQSKWQVLLISALASYTARYLYLHPGVSGAHLKRAMVVALWQWLPGFQYNMAVHLGDLMTQCFLCWALQGYQWLGIQEYSCVWLCGSIGLVWNKCLYSGNFSTGVLITLYLTSCACFKEELCGVLSCSVLQIQGRCMLAGSVSK